MTRTPREPDGIFTPREFLAMFFFAMFVWGWPFHFLPADDGPPVTFMTFTCPDCLMGAGAAGVAACAAMAAAARRSGRRRAQRGTGPAAKRPV